MDRQRLTVAMQSLQQLLRRPSVSGASFLDVGCGSGLFSLAAHQLGAERVVGVDINPRCVAVSAENRDLFVSNAPVVFQKASALHSPSLEALGQFQIVYAWGSLHHTGAMWDAICNVAQCVAPGGTLVLAIYNKHITSPAWTAIKWFYNQMPGVVRWLMAIVFACIIFIAKWLVTRRNPLDKERGMDFWYDVVDWIGGYPYEYASLQEVETFMRGLGFALDWSVPAQVPTGCNEFVFHRTDE